MTLETAAAIAMFIGVVAYGIFGGADFGSGFYDLTAGGARRGAQLRTQIDHSIGPVWEANHVWLIYVLVFCWTAFPRPFVAAMTTLIIPLLLALLGIVLRGAGFVFRKYSASMLQARIYGAIFAGASLITPFFFGTVVGAIASGRVPAEGNGDRWASWVNVTSLSIGVVAVASCSFLAGTFLTADAARAGHRDLASTLRRRTLAVGVVTGVLAIACLAPVAVDAPTLADGLLGRAAPLIVVSIVGGFAAVALMWRRRPGIARIPAVVAVAAVIIGWGSAQYPWLLVDEVTIVEGAGAPATLTAILIVAGVAAVLVLPPLIYLLHLTQSEKWTLH
ncbi:cytochrome d ubiquinol oxidase subunit II [Brachybacterium muris]|uniref:cytochrome d ubiquinol oxidase subunit II n=1 Tax=Brachybacterium muris TaxID=219301 RepID=UPI00223B4274|nr:cytochrome d ubiquinol oxidase subunit II [Brachybacterium muris]MCT2178476.1 cytochrome d ubiquinol oxidase subunit II [Brachybacterium muris]MCT2262619.1 cytochrome d ubiquinol oxidase subunit II [Brachybacterium muris]MCT2296576.1 cytochrome d ubiquinol oxidase subunit II [Brachybacterium muris]